MAANQPGEANGEQRIREGWREAPMVANQPGANEERSFRDVRLEAPMNNQQSTEAMDEWVAGLLAEALAKNAFPNIYG